MRGLTIRIYLNPKLYIEKYTDLCMFFSERIDLYIKSMIDLINFQYSRDGMGRLSDISRPWSSTCEHKSTKTKRYGFMWVSATGQPSPSHLLTSWQCYPLGVESPSTWHVPVQWVAVGECIPIIPRAAPFQLESPNSCSKHTPAQRQDPLLPFVVDATLSYHLYSLHDLF